MNGFLRLATASQTRSIGPFLDDTDFISPETGLTIANTDVKVIKNGTSSNKNSGGGTHIINGDYSFTFDATDTDTIGEIEISINVTGAMIVKRTYTVIDTKVYDALYSATPTLLTSLDIGQLYEGDVTIVNSQTNFDLGISITTDDNWIGNTVTINDVSTGDSNTRWVTDVDQTNDRIIINAAPTFTVEVGDLLRVESRINPLYATSLLNDVSTAQVNAEVDTALVDIHLDHLFQTNYDPESKPGVPTALLNEMIESDGGVSRYTANALENTISVAQVNTEVDTALSDIHLDHLFAVDYDPAAKPGVATALLNEIVEDDAGVSRFTANALDNTITTAQVNTEVDTALADIHLDHLFQTNYDPAAKPGSPTALLNELIESDGGVSRFTANALEQGTANVWAQALGNTSLTASQLMQIIAGIAAGKLSGADTSTITFRNIEDTANLAVVTTDVDGNRSAITLTNPTT